MLNVILIISFLTVFIGVTFFCLKKEMSTLRSVAIGIFISLFFVSYIHSVYEDNDIITNNEAISSQNKLIDVKEDNQDVVVEKSKSVSNKPFPYKIMEIRDISHASSRRVVYNVYLETQKTPAKNRLEATANDIWKQNKRGWDEFTIFMIFGPITDFSAGAYSRAEFDKRELKNLVVFEHVLQILPHIKDDLPKQVEAKPLPKPWELEDNTTDASIILTDLVKERLVSPSTAKFPGMFERRSHVRHVGAGRYIINSWVDSQNIYGAMVRTNYYAEIQQVGPELHSGHWKIIRFEKR
jgi:hypothetical protein